MKNRVISLILVGALTVTSTLQAEMFEQTSSTSYSQWKDPASNITYTNFGSVNFRFKKGVRNFAPWVKLRPPGVKAGCGGVSLDAGFAAFLDLETIGKQLEQAISSVGMGVIVVLIQTMPSIGKAYENIQKLIRKMQSLLQNSCQLTVQGLSNDPWVLDKKKQMEDAVNENEGMQWFNDSMKGAIAKVDAAKSILTCDSTDHKCLENAKNVLSINSPVADKSGNVAKSASTGIDEPIVESINSLYGSITSVPAKTPSDSISNVFSKKFDTKTFIVDTSDMTAYKLKMAMFGTLAIKAGDGDDGLKGLKEDGTIDPQEAAEATEDSSGGPSYTTIFTPPMNGIPEVTKFLTGVDVNGTAVTNTIYIPADINYVVKLSCDKSTKDSGCAAGSVSLYHYLQWKDGASDSNKIAISWEGIERASYKTILNAVDSSKYPLPANPIGVYMPNGNKFVQMIRDYAKSEDVEKYAEFLAKINVRYAVKALVREAKAEASDMVRGENRQARIALQQYLEYANATEKAVLKSIEDYSGDVEYLNNINQVFDNLKQSTLQRRMKRAKAQ
jgi:hypothetical protein